MSECVCRVISPGVGLTVQDFGRPGWRRFGLPASGAMDFYSMGWANRLLGNALNAPVLELAFQGVKLEFLRDAWIACCGADMDASLEPWSARLVSAGEILSFRRNISGVYGYLAVLGGWKADTWFGSHSVNSRALLGRSLQEGDQLYSRLGNCCQGFGGTKRRIVSLGAQRDFSRSRVVRVFKGLQFDDFAPEEVASFVSNKWIISPRSDRTGYRLDGGEIKTTRVISSEPTLPGSVQVTPSGQPIVTLNDGPTVGGYPKIALVHPNDLSWFTQCGPNQEISFQWVD